MFLYFYYAPFKRKIASFKFIQTSFTQPYSYSDGLIQNIAKGKKKQTAECQIPLEKTLKF